MHFHLYFILPLVCQCHLPTSKPYTNIRNKEKKRKQQGKGKNYTVFNFLFIFQVLMAWATFNFQGILITVTPPGEHNFSISLYRVDHVLCYCLNLFLWRQRFRFENLCALVYLICFLLYFFLVSHCHFKNINRH